MGIGTRVGDDDQTGLLERARDIVGEVTGSETASDGDSSGVSGELEDCALAVGSSGNDSNVSRVVDCRDDAGCEDDFLPDSR